MTRSSVETLVYGLQQLALDPTLLDSLEQYLALLQKWNRVHNLVGTRGEKDIVTRHILDCLSVVEHLAPHRRIVDLGSGAGLPGLMLALALPENELVLLEGQAKRAGFLRQAVLELEISNVLVVETPVLALTDSGRFDAVVARAFGSLSKVLAASDELCVARAPVYVMKGKVPQCEIEAVRLNKVKVTLHRLHVPGLSAERHLVVMSA